MLLLFPLLLLLVISTAEAQLPENPDARVIVSRAIERRAKTRADSTFFAEFREVSRAAPKKGNSMVALLPEQTFLREVKGIVFHKAGEDIKTQILVQRGSALPAGPAGNIIANLQAIGDYASIDDNRMVLLNTSLVSPLADDALEYYEFRVTGLSSNDSVPAYTVEIHPTNRLVPAFEGTMTIAGYSHDILDISLRTSSQTGLPFLDEISLTQRFSPVQGGISQPEYVEVMARGTINAVAFGVAEPEVWCRLERRLSSRQMYGEAPPNDWESILSRYTQGIRNPDEDWSMPGRPTGFLTATEALAVERQRDSLSQPSGFGFSVGPYIDYNRAGGATLGASPSISYGITSVAGTGAYSFGMKRPVGEGWLIFTLGMPDVIQMTLRGGAFSRLEATTTGDKTYPRIMSTLVTASLHQDYYNFFRKDGWGISADMEAGSPLKLSIAYERAHHFSVGNNARWALLTLNSKEFQPNPPVTEGQYETIFGQISWGQPAPFLKITPVGHTETRWSISALQGNEISTSTDFFLLEGLLSVSIPVIETGYAPMTLILLGAGGAGTSTIPPQYQFRLRTSAATFGKPGGFVSPPKGVYGGTEYIALGTELNLTDLWWRALNLPLVNKRGVELIVGGGAARYVQKHHTGYLGTGDGWYPEAGLALSRIPLFLTDIMAGRVDARWGFGPLGAFGANFTFVVPL